MSPRYAKALSEVDYIITNLEKEEYEKIPSKFRDFIKNNKDRIYKIESTDNLTEETLAILSFIYRKFLAPLEEREKLELEYNEKLKHEKELARKQNTNSEIKYEYKVIGNEKINVEEIVIENLALVECVKEKWYKKIFQKIKDILGKK